MSLLTRLGQRWGIEPDLQTALPFAEMIGRLNMRRLELACALLLLNDVLEFSTGYHLAPVMVEMPLALIMLAASRPLRATPPWVQRWIALAVLALFIGLTQWATAVIARGSHIPSGYLVRLLTCTLLFVLAPAELAIGLAISFVCYIGVIWSIPSTTGSRIAAIVNAGIISVICQVAGWLIYSGRLTDYEQKRRIERQNALLAARNRELDEVMAITAHDLRSPLYGLRNLLRFAADPPPAEPRMVQVLRDGVASLDAMLALVTRLLDMHHAEHAPPALQAIDLRDPIAEAARRLAARARMAGITIALPTVQAPVRAIVDPSAMAQILDNLLDNAIRHSPAGGTIRIDLAEAPGQALIRVEDQGLGVAEEVRPFLFDKFRSLIVDRRGPGANGLGLFIAATLAAKMGGTLSHRDAEPHGALFELTVPVLPGLA
jgi:signal transduction histidine kinase